MGKIVYVKVVHFEGDTPVELPSEEDSTLLLTTLQAAFPDACGLVYKNSQSGSVRGVRLVEGRFYSPEEGWGEQTFVCTGPNNNKRKSNEDEATPPKKKAHLISDLIILGLPWKTTDEEVKDYFEQFGEVTMATVKKNQRTGQSKGFGFVRFAEFSSQVKVIGKRHQICGRWCDVKIPYSKNVDASQACKIFVGQLRNGITEEDIKGYFSDYGDVSDVYIPQPFRMFGFVTFTDPFTAKAVCATSNHSINGSPVNVSVAIPPVRKNDERYYPHSTPKSDRAGVKRQFNDEYNDLENQSYFNTSGDWNAKQGRMSLLWDETPWDLRQ